MTCLAGWGGRGEEERCEGAVGVRCGKLARYNHIFPVCKQSHKSWRTKRLVNPDGEAEVAVPQTLDMLDTSIDLGSCYYYYYYYGERQTHKQKQRERMGKVHTPGIRERKGKSDH